MMAPLDVHPLARAIPEMLTDEFIALVNDIKKNGIKQPIILFENMILDGRHRAKACVELGIEAATEEFLGTKDEAEALVLSLNVHRRHLTLEQKQKIIKCELLSDPQQSDRAIAKKAKVDHKTVAVVRKKAEAGGEIPHHETRVGGDGVKQPAKKPEAKKKRSRTVNFGEFGAYRGQIVADSIARCLRTFESAAGKLITTRERTQLRDGLVAAVDAYMHRKYPEVVAEHEGGAL